MNSVRTRCARWFLLLGVVAIVLLCSLDAVLAEGKGKGGGGQGKGKGKGGGGGVDNAILLELQHLLPLFAKLDNNPKDFKQLERAFQQLLGIVLNDNAKGNMGKGMAQVGKKGQGQQKGGGQGGKGQAGKGGGKGGMMCGNVGQQAGKNCGKKPAPNNAVQNGAGKPGQGGQIAKKGAPMNVPKLQPKNAFAKAGQGPQNMQGGKKAGPMNAPQMQPKIAFAKAGQAPQNMQFGKAPNKAGPGGMQQKFQGAKAPFKGPGGGGQQNVMAQRAPQFFAVAGNLGGKAGAGRKK